ncbi:MAG: peptidoglycan editing factor PgeF [Halofilum sp. (in: g-proteobacteria)]
MRALTTTRIGGVSGPPYSTLNLGLGGADDPATVAANRRRLRAALGLTAEPGWLRQVHGARVVELSAEAEPGEPPEADAAWTDRPGVACAILTADCLPVVLADEQGKGVAAAHAGWRGLAAGVLEATVGALPVPAGRCRAWLGPAIGPRAFEVGPEVREKLLDADPGAGAAFARGTGDRWLADLYALARRRLRAAGVQRIGGGVQCTFSEPNRFFSHRRDGGATGRMATLVWLRH